MKLDVKCERCGIQVILDPCTKPHYGTDPVIEHIDARCPKCGDLRLLVQFYPKPLAGHVNLDFLLGTERNKKRVGDE